MAQTVTPQLLVQIPLFSNMDDEERHEILSIMTERIFQTGHPVLKAGEPNNTFHIIQNGEVEIWLLDTENKKVVLDTLGPGKFFGELTTLSNETRSANVISEEELVTLELEREEFFAFLRRRPDAAIDVLTQLGEHLKHTDNILRTRVSQNPNDAVDEKVSFGQRIADVIADFSGSLAFLMLNFVIFVVWILLNTVAPALFRFDPYPFQFLTMSVSLEAIFLSIFVLISQNRQASKDRIKADLDYQVDVKAELEMSVLGTKVRDIELKLHHIHEDILERNSRPDK
jgi:CRP/FNR family transcriptional regulator, cyclic AMP receptor protein